MPRRSAHLLNAQAFHSARIRRAVGRARSGKGRLMVRVSNSRRTVFSPSCNKPASRKMMCFQNQSPGDLRCGVPAVSQRRIVARPTPRTSSVSPSLACGRHLLPDRIHLAAAHPSSSSDHACVPLASVVRPWRLRSRTPSGRRPFHWRRLQPAPDPPTLRTVRPPAEAGFPAVGQVSRPGRALDETSRMAARRLGSLHAAQDGADRSLCHRAQIPKGAAAGSFGLPSPAKAHAASRTAATRVRRATLAPGRPALAG
jgi:hypothetical protein